MIQRSQQKRIWPLFSSSNQFGPFVWLLLLLPFYWFGAWTLKPQQMEGGSGSSEFSHISGYPSKASLFLVPLAPFPHYWVHEGLQNSRPSFSFLVLGLQKDLILLGRRNLVVPSQNLRQVERCLSDIFRSKVNFQQGISEPLGK